MCIRDRFTEEWKRIRVSDLLDFYSTNSLSWAQLEYESNEPYNLHYGLIHVGLPTFVDLTKDKLPSIKEENVPKKYESVSYTHLDVYKRQSPACSRKSGVSLAV